MTRRPALTALILLAGVFALSTAWALEAELLSVEGRVQYRISSSAEWQNASRGDKLPQGAEIVTSSNSGCQLRVGPSESAVRIQPDSRAVLTSLQPVKIQLESGRLFALVRNLEKGSTFEVRTPTAMAAARGTGWGQDSDKVEVFESVVDVTGAAGGQKNVNEGQGIRIGDDGTLGDLFDIPESDKNDWKEFKESAGGGSDSGNEADKDAPDDQSLDAPGAPETFMSDVLDSKDQTSQANDEKALSDLKTETKDTRQGGY